MFKTPLYNEKKITVASWREEGNVRDGHQKWKEIKNVKNNFSDGLFHHFKNPYGLNLGHTYSWKLKVIPIVTDSVATCNDQ